MKIMKMYEYGEDTTGSSVQILSAFLHRTKGECTSWDSYMKDL